MAMDFDNITLISDSNVLAIPIKDNGDRLVNLKDFLGLRRGESNRGSFDLCWYLRASVISKLLKVQSNLPDGIQLLIDGGYRPLSLQKEFFDKYWAEVKTSHSDWPREKIYQEVVKYVAPPEIAPPHSTGGAVDLTLCDENGTKLDMGTSLDATPQESDNGCFMAAENISDEAKKNRGILMKAMDQQGFVNYPTEWWHWSYGDRYWAYAKKQEFALFGSIEPSL